MKVILTTWRRVLLLAMGGIGNTAPTQKLDVTGDINYSGQIRKAGTALTLTCSDVASSASTGDTVCTAQGAGYTCTSVSGGGRCAAATTGWFVRCCKTNNN